MISVLADGTNALDSEDLDGNSGSLDLSGSVHSRTAPLTPCNISVDFLSLIERGINAPSFETIERMAKKLRPPVMALFDFTQRA